ncbi:MAG: hypothetical protein WEB88_09825 [Gemmatimonadota bacterium]
MPDAASAPEANRLYWESELPVAAIAERLDISRRSLYEFIAPCPAPGACPACGGSLGYANRTARDRGMTVCAACGAEVEAGQAAPPETEGSAAESTRRPPAVRPAADRQGTTGGARPTARSMDERTAGILAAVVAGVAAGALGALLFGGRR